MAIDRGLQEQALQRCGQSIDFLPRRGPFAFGMVIEAESGAPERIVCVRCPWCAAEHLHRWPVEQKTRRLAEFESKGKTLIRRQGNEASLGYQWPPCGGNSYDVIVFVEDGERAVGCRP